MAFATALVKNALEKTADQSAAAATYVTDSVSAMRKDSFADKGPKAGSLEEVAEAGDPVAQKVVEEKKEERKLRLWRAGLLDILMGALAAFVAFRYNRNEKRGWLKILTVVAAFFFWPFYCLYILIRSGALGQTESIVKVSDLTGVLGQVKDASMEAFDHFKETASKDQLMRLKGGYYY